MRTKAEALANPMAGDRWRIETHDWPWSDPTVLTQAEDDEVRMRYADGTSTWMTGIGFRAVMADAEYLGGAE
jgi:hypothetical protein